MEHATHVLYNLHNNRYHPNQLTSHMANASKSSSISSIANAEADGHVLENPAAFCLHPHPLRSHIADLNQNATASRTDKPNAIGRTKVDSQHKSGPAHASPKARKLLGLDETAEHKEAQVTDVKPSEPKKRGKLTKVNKATKPLKMPAEIMSKKEKMGSLSKIYNLFHLPHAKESAAVQEVPKLKICPPRPPRPDEGLDIIAPRVCTTQLPPVVAGPKLKRLAGPVIPQIAGPASVTNEEAAPVVQNVRLQRPQNIRNLMLDQSFGDHTRGQLPDAVLEAIKAGNLVVEASNVDLLTLPLKRIEMISIPAGPDDCTTKCVLENGSCVHGEVVKRGQELGWYKNL